MAITSHSRMRTTEYSHGIRIFPLIRSPICRLGRASASRRVTPWDPQHYHGTWPLHASSSDSVTDAEASGLQNLSHGDDHDVTEAVAPHAGALVLGSDGAPSFRTGIQVSVTSEDVHGVEELSETGQLLSAVCTQMPCQF